MTSIWIVILDILLHGIFFECSNNDMLLVSPINLCSNLPTLLLPQIKLVNEESYKKTFEEIVRSLDKMENECIPSLTLSRREVSGQELSDSTWIVIGEEYVNIALVFRNTQYNIISEHWQQQDLVNDAYQLSSALNEQD